MAVLLTIIGRGRKEKSNPNVYEKTVYQFNNNCTVATSVFLDAILSSHCYEIDHCIVVGTTTSAWNVLLDPYIENDNNEIDELYLRIEDECAKQS